MKAFNGVANTDSKPGDEHSTFGSLIKKYRKDKGYSLKHLESMANVDHTYINRIENGTRKEVSFFKVIRLAVCLGIPYNVLISEAFGDINLDGLDQEEILQENPWFKYNYEVNDLVVSGEIKDILNGIVEFIFDSTWDSRTKVQELYQLSEMIDDLKEKLQK